MGLPGVAALREERVAFVETLDGLSDEHFESGPTLCSEWAPRDVLAHLMGIDTGMHHYVLALGNVDQGSRRIVERARTQPRARLMHRARHWASHAPPPTTQVVAGFLLGDVVMHHQDVLRPLGRTRVLSRAARQAIYREGLTLGVGRWIKHRCEPTDGGFAFGFGSRVSGSCEALGLWLAGRQGVDHELHFDGFLNVTPPADPPPDPPGVLSPDVEDPAPGAGGRAPADG